MVEEAPLARTTSLEIKSNQVTYVKHELTKDISILMHSKMFSTLAKRRCCSHTKALSVASTQTQQQIPFCINKHEKKRQCRTNIYKFLSILHCKSSRPRRKATRMLHTPS